MSEVKLDVVQCDLELCLSCNLQCPYCYLGQKPSNCKMSDDTLLQAFEFVERFGHMHKKGKEYPTRVNFYGGEPMLAWDHIEKFVTWTKQKNYDTAFIIVSNGTIGTPEQAEFCRKHNIPITRSIDGCPEALACGRGKNSPTLLERYREQTKIWKDHGKGRRMTFVPEASKYMLKSLRFINEDLGIAKGGGMAPDLYVPWTEEQIQDCINSLWEVAEEYVKDWKAGKPFPFTWFERETRRYNLPAKINDRHFRMNQGCGAGNKLMAVSWDGYVFPCHRFTTEERGGGYCYGHVTECINGTAKGYSKEFSDRFAWIREGNVPDVCAKCPSNITCSGGCPHNHMKVMGDIAMNVPTMCRMKMATAPVVDWIDSQLRKIDAAWWTPAAKAKHRRRLAELQRIRRRTYILQDTPRQIPRINSGIVVGTSVLPSLTTQVCTAIPSRRRKTQ